MTRFVVASGSMEPLIHVGEMIEVAPYRGTAARFDILVFWNGKVPVCHLVWHINYLKSDTGSTIYVTRPFNPRSKGREDLPIPEERVLGVVTSHRIGWLARLKLSFSALPCGSIRKP